MRQNGRGSANRKAVLVLSAALLLLSSLGAGPAGNGVYQAPTATIIGRHVVQRGETLFCLGRAYGVLPAAIAAANYLRPPFSLSPGQVLLIPAVPWGVVPPGPVCAAQFKSPFPALSFTPPAGAVASVSVTAAATPVSSLRRHVVRAGETLFCIGRAYGVPPLAIAAANGLLWPYRLSPGQILIIPTERWENVPPGPVCAAQWTPTTLPPLPAPTATNEPREKAPPDTPPPVTSPPPGKTPTVKP